MLSSEESIGLRAPIAGLRTVMFVDARHTYRLRLNHGAALFVPAPSLTNQGIDLVTAHNQSVCQAIVHFAEKNEGLGDFQILKYVGDAVLISFSSDDPDLIVECAQAVIDGVETRWHDLEDRVLIENIPAVGISRGDVITFLHGDSEDWAVDGWTIDGWPIVIAAALERIGGPGQILVDFETVPCGKSSEVVLLPGVGLERRVAVLGKGSPAALISPLHLRCELIALLGDIDRFRDDILKLRDQLNTGGEAHYQSRREFDRWRDLYSLSLLDGGVGSVYNVFARSTAALELLFEGADEQALGRIKERLGGGDVRYLDRLEGSEVESFDGSTLLKQLQDAALEHRSTHELLWAANQPTVSAMLANLSSLLSSTNNLSEWIRKFVLHLEERSLR